MGNSEQHGDDSVHFKVSIQVCADARVCFLKYRAAVHHFQPVDRSQCNHCCAPTTSSVLYSRAFNERLGVSNAFPTTACAQPSLRTFVLTFTALNPLRTDEQCSRNSFKHKMRPFLRVYRPRFCNAPEFKPKKLSTLSTNYQVRRLINCPRRPPSPVYFQS